MALSFNFETEKLLVTKLEVETDGSKTTYGPTVMSFKDYGDELLINKARTFAKEQAAYRKYGPKSKKNL